MSKAPAPSSPAGDDVVREQLDRVLSSPQFLRSERLARLLRMIVESGLNGDVAGLKESILGREVYDRGSDFDGRVDPIVRTEMRRLRRKLVEYYESSGLSDPVVIEIPKGGYVPSFRTRNPWAPRLQGESLGAYTVLERLGAGPSGVTYRVVDSSTGTEFAVKQLAPGISGQFDAFGSLCADMEAATVLESEETCRIESVEQTQDGVLLRSKFHEGVTLEERLLSAELSWRESEEIARQLLALLASAHQRGVAHGHLKPSDILLNTVHGEIRVVVLNFGTRPLAARVVIRPDGRRMGTTGYAECHAGADHSSDVRSAGAILYQLFTRSLPSVQAQSGSLTFPFRPDVPLKRHDGLASLLARCLAADPGERFASAVEMAEAFLQPAGHVEASVAPRPIASWKDLANRLMHAVGFSPPFRSKD